MTISAVSHLTPVTREEINFVRLLSRCEDMLAESAAAGLSGRQAQDDWRVRQYLISLQTRLTSLSKSPHKPTPAAMAAYKQRVSSAQLVADTRFATNRNRKNISELLLPVASAVGVGSASSQEISSDTGLPRSSSTGSSRHHFLRDQSDGRQKSRHMLQHARSQVIGDMRRELMGSASSGALGSTSGSSEDKSSMAAVLKHHKESQEKIAEEMLFLARGMKEHAQAASRIVKEDNERLVEVTQLAVGNEEKLKVETARLETHLQRCCNWWMWSMIVMVIISFLAMNVFMKLFPKR